MLVIFEMFYPRNQESNSETTRFINPILAHDLKKLQEDVKKEKKLKNQQLEECDKELPKTEIMEESMENRLAEEREEI